MMLFTMLFSTLSIPVLNRITILQEVHSENSSVIQYNDENSLACVLTLAYYSAQDTYSVYRELQGGDGFADLVFIPRSGNKNPAMIIELKWNKNAGIALNQIKDRNYIKCLKDYRVSVKYPAYLDITKRPR